jgi:tetrahydromethanopterin S-methyltransferase subunit B
MSGDQDQYIPVSEAERISEAKTRVIADDFRDRLIGMERRVEEKIDKLDRKIDDSKTRVIETLGIFVALFTFISVEFQALRSLQDTADIAGITLIFLGGLLLFVTVLDLILNVNLQFFKRKSVKGAGTLRRLGEVISGRGEIVPLKWTDPNTWGEAMKFKILPLIFVEAVLIVGGVYLLIWR